MWVQFSTPFCCSQVSLCLLKNSSHVDDFSVVLAHNLQLRQIDLSSLESISGGGVLVFNNPQLCYVGNLTTYLDNQTTQHQCIVAPSRRDPQICSESCDVPPLLHNVYVTLILIGCWLSESSWAIFLASSLGHFSRFFSTAARQNLGVAWGWGYN